MESAERIEELLKYSNMSAKKFAETIGIKTVQSLYDIQKGKIKNISKAIAGKVSEAFPEIEKDWILTGKGNMIKNTNSGQNFGSIEGKNKSSYSNVGNSISISLPETGTQKIIKPDGTIDIQSLNSSVYDSNEVDRLNQRIQYLESIIAEKERIIVEKDATIKSKDEMICLLKTMFDKQ